MPFSLAQQVPNMAVLRLQLLGEMKVLREDQELNLPPSKKTRALLAYLAVTEKQHRREALCELLWEIPDDPRGSLRWSLSKIRRLVDDEQQQRIEADRNVVSMRTEHIASDVHELNELVRNGFAQVETDELITAASRLQGQFLEGLELANFHEFSSWCLAEREQANRDRLALLSELVDRLESQAENCLPYARELVGLKPYDKSNRVRLIQILVACGREKEAKQQVEQGTSLLQEVGEDSIALQRALKEKPEVKNSSPPAIAKPQTEIPPSHELPDSTQCASKLVGRDEEISLLQKSWQDVQEQRKAQCVLFRGEPGIGKTSLIDCAYQIARNSGATVFRAGAFESEIVRPFALWHDALRESSHVKAVDLLSGDERIDRDRLLTSLSKLVQEESLKNPVLLIFDDMQWSDESSAAALHYVLRTNAQQAIWVILGAREEELQSNFPVLSAIRGLKQDNTLTSIKLEPLQEEDVMSLVVREAPEADVRTISEKSRGNPFLALELARAVAAGDVLGTLNELIGDRISRMQETTVSMLQWAAVLAPNISIGALLRYTKLEDEALDQALEQAEKNGFLFATENGYKYSHDLVTRSIYRAISPARRRNMHRRVAELLEVDTAVDLKLASELARHAALSGDAQLASRSMLQAARLCLRFFANDDAYNLATRCQDYLQDLNETERVCLMIGLKEVKAMAAPVEDWKTEIDQCIALAESALDLGQQEYARLGYQLASNMRWAHGQWSGAHRSIMQAERVSRGGSESVQIIGMAEAARCLLLLERDLPEADALLMEATARAERNRVDSDAIPAAKGLMCYYEGKLKEAEEFLDEARTRAKALGDRMNEFQANEYLTMIEIDKEAYDAAKECSRNLMRIGEKLREGSEAPFAQALAGICQYADAGDDESVNTATDLLRKFDAKQRLTFVLNRAAILDLRKGKFENAIKRATEALTNAEIMDRNSEIITARTIMAEAYKAQEDQANTQLQIDALLAMGTESGAQLARQRAEKIISKAEKT